MKCTYHPDVETSLRCGKCGKPICSKDMVQTLVGARCPECARLSKLPTYQVTVRYYLRATVAGLGVALVCGVVWGLIGTIIPFFYLNLLVAAGIGYAIGEAVSFSVNRKRGLGLAVVAGGSVVISYLAGLLTPWLQFEFFDLLAIALGIFIAVTRVR
jgi:DNA-directed RNA polymerase subunit RPC12/RpoP